MTGTATPPYLPAVPDRWLGGQVEPIGPADAVSRPDGVDLSAIVARAVSETPSGVLARVWVADGRATHRVGREIGAGIARHNQN